MSNDVPGKEYSRDKRKKLLEADIQAYLPDIEEVTTTMSIAKMRASSVKGYGSYLRLFAAWLVLYCDSVRFADITVEQLRDYIEFLNNDQCLAPNTINAYLAAIRKMYQVIRNEDLSKRVLPDLVVDTHVPIVPSVQDVALMLKACTTLMEKLLLAILITTGMRISEVLSMRFKDVEKAQERIYVPYSKGHIAGYVPLSPKVVALLTQYCNEYSTANPLNRLTPDDYVFFNKDRSNHMSIHQVRSIYNKIQDRAGLRDKHFTFHKLRHYFGLNLYLQSHDLVLVKTVLRHKTIAATLVYVILAASIDAQKRYKNPGEMAFEMCMTEDLL
ncbi:MAG: site-specific integrase [Clostridia bacterium]|nr:site-specific integrase [Clostridia bacterium]MBQ9325883.1 site-specific integrase [Clostridia bacterium]